MTSTLPNDNIRNFDDQITNKLISEIIRDRIKNSGTRFSANDNISDFINPGELEILEKEVASRVKDLLKSLVIDVENDHNTQETAERVSKMYLNEVFKGRYHEQPKVTSFPNDKNLDEIYTVGPISVRSACSHHLVPILGECWIGIKPGYISILLEISNPSGLYSVSISSIHSSDIPPANHHGLLNCKFFK